MERQCPNEQKLRSIYWSDKANGTNERLQIAHIFKQSNFMYGKESKYPNAHPPKLLTICFVLSINSTKSTYLYIPKIIPTV